VKQPIRIATNYSINWITAQNKWGNNFGCFFLCGWKGKLPVDQWEHHFERLARLENVLLAYITR
jgi:hypothetical protein